MIQECVRAGLRGPGKVRADIERAILADLRRNDRPGVRVIAAAHGVSTRSSASPTRSDPPAFEPTLPLRGQRRSPGPQNAWGRVPIAHMAR